MNKKLEPWSESYQPDDKETIKFFTEPNYKPKTSEEIMHAAMEIAVDIRSNAT